MPKAKYNNKFNSIQKKIIRFINETPGIRYRELLRITGVSNGALSYNLNLLNNSGMVRVNKVNVGVTRYFSRDVSALESNVIGLLRQNTTRKIIVYMLKYGPCHFNDIVNYTHKAPSTIS
jgi:predicted transcriptional regulator